MSIADLTNLYMDDTDLFQLAYLATRGKVDIEVKMALQNLAAVCASELDDEGMPLRGQFSDELIAGAEHAVREAAEA